MKNLFTLILLLYSITVFAQSNDMKARMEYEDAEIAYQNGNYTVAIAHLETAEKLLGKATAKTRYLLVLALSKTLPADYQYKDMEKLKNISKHYLDNYSNTDAAKYREIYDLYNRLDKNYPQSLAAYNKIKQDKKDKEEQERLAKQRARDAVKAGILADMIPVEGGTFNMGSKKEKDEKPMHSVTVGSFSMGKYPVTVGQYRVYCNATGKEMPAAPSWGWAYDHPMVNVSWEDAVAYTQWLSKEIGGECRLPTEAEWEYAACGGNKTNGYTYSGSNSIDEVAWHDGNSGSKTHPVGGKKPNELGIYDMSGNVWEWCGDWYGADYYKSSLANNPKGPASGSYRVLRGGSWYDTASYCRVAFRNRSDPSFRNVDRGFRVVLSQ